MRYFVVSGPSTSSKSPYIVAEIVRDLADGGAREDSLAGQLAGPRLRVMTREEIRAMPDGPEVLERWNRGDDKNFHLETALLTYGHDDESIKARLRLVAEDGRLLPEEPLSGGTSGDKLSELLQRAAVLQAQTLEIIERVRAQTAQRGITQDGRKNALGPVPIAREGR